MRSSDACRDAHAVTLQTDGMRGKIANDAVVLAARAQQAERVRRIGVAAALAEDDPEMVARRAAFEQALQVLGWTVERNIRIEYRLAAIDPARTQKFAVELAALTPDVILVSS